MSGDRTTPRLIKAGNGWVAPLELELGTLAIGLDVTGVYFVKVRAAGQELHDHLPPEDRPALEEFAVTLCKQLDKWEGWRPWSEVGEAKESGRVVIFDWPGGSVSHKVRWIANRERWRNLAGRYREYEDRSFDKALWTYAPGEKA